MSTTESPCCGQCPNFDRRNVEGKPVGEVIVVSEEGVLAVQQGFCRAPLGLVLGARKETSSCIHPEFKDRNNSEVKS